MDWIKDNRRMLTFFVIVLVSVSLHFIIYMCSHRSYVESHNMIVEQYKTQITKTDKTMAEINRKISKAKEKKADSLFVELQSKYLTASEDQRLFHQSVKSMLELEFNKIQNEYETQEIWIGLITIVFLIFSFYSIMKSEQFEQQCREDAQRVHNLTESAAAMIEGINTDKGAKLKNIDDEFKNWKETSIITIKSDAGKAIKDELNSTKKDREARYKEIVDKWDSDLSVQVQRVMADLSTFEEESKKKCNARVEELLSVTEKKVMMEVKRILDNFDNDLSNVNGLIDKRIDKYMEEHTATTEDIDKMFEEVFGQTIPSVDVNPDAYDDEKVTNEDTKPSGDHEK